MKKMLATTIAMAIAAISFYPQAAHAGWTPLPVPSSASDTVSSARACKTYVVSPLYGGLWRVNYQVFRKTDRVKSITVSAFRFAGNGLNFSVVGAETNNQWLYGVVAGTGGNVYASIFHDDRFVFQVNFANGAASVDTLTPAQIANC